MDPIIWAEAFGKLAKARGIRLGRGGDRKSTATVALDKAAALAKEVGVKPRTARYRLQTAENLNSHPDLKEKVRGDTVA